MIEFSQVDKDLGALLKQYGPRRRSVYPEYPFWRLKNDGLWELSNTENVSARKGNTNAKKIDLLKFKVFGGFPEPVQCLLATDKSLVTEIVSELLARNFPDTLHESILSATGIELETTVTGKIIRNPDFRKRILRAYQYRCAICGFDVRLGDRLVAIEACHIKWHQAGGPETGNNGLALCCMHHKLFDLGVVTISDSMTVMVSEEAHGTAGFQEGNGLQRHKDQTPIRDSYFPNENFLAWHVSEVFQGPGRI